jgi:hypothetical protein
VRGAPLRGWPDRDGHAAFTPSEIAVWSVLAQAAVHGIRENAGLPAELHQASSRIRLVFDSAAPAVRFAAGLRAENTHRKVRWVRRSG